MAAYCQVYDSYHLQADYQEPGSAPEPYARWSSMGYLFYTKAAAVVCLSIQSTDAAYCYKWSGVIRLCVWWAHPWAMQKWLKRLRCHLGQTRMGQGAMYEMGARALVPTGKCNRSISAVVVMRPIATITVATCLLYTNSETNSQTFKKLNEIHFPYKTGSLSIFDLYNFPIMPSTDLTWNKIKKWFLQHLFYFISDVWTSVHLK